MNIIVADSTADHRRYEPTWVLYHLELFLKSVTTRNHLP